MARQQTEGQFERDPLWYKRVVIYQCHVRAFYDSDGNGKGDFRGLTQKLDYVQDLGVTAIWLLPFYPSPLKDDGYDIADYYQVHADYGTLSDFRTFLKEAHRRGLRVITELVVNHTSDQHPWFQKSRRAAPGSKWRDYYVWSDTAEKYKDARIIFKDFETSNWTWDPVANAYFWHRFYSHQPDLNYDNPQVHREIFKVLDFWLDMGVDGLRLDAVPYLYEREGTNCENLRETHEFLKLLRRHVDERYGDRLLLAEANQWPEDAVAYFGSGRGDECHMAFHFPVMPRMFMSVRMEDRVPIVDILEQTPSIPETSQWALFLRNHDELTLEMVTDEERDYMYRMYATDPRARINLGIRRRLAPLLGNDRKRIELLNALLLSLPGTPVIYYGDEIGMGENVFLGDRNGVRTPMQWSSDRNAGFSRANPQGLYLPIVVDAEYHYESINVEAQQQNVHSLLWWMKRMLGLRQHWKSLGHGSIEFLHPENRKILAYLRRYEDECVLVVANLSRFVQPVELDLTAYQQFVPVEVIGRTHFPPITDRPYFLTLSPHSFYWFSLERRYEAAAIVDGAPAEVPSIVVAEEWQSVLEGRTRVQLERVLGQYVLPRRWFGSKSKEIKALTIREAVPTSYEGDRSYLLLLEVEYVQGDPETYTLPLAHIPESEAEELKREYPQLVIARVQVEGADAAGLLYDASGSKRFGRGLFEAMVRRKALRGLQGEVLASNTSLLKSIRGEQAEPPEPSIGRAEQSNTAIIFGDKFILKLFRKVDEGLNPDLELGRYLTAKQFPHTAPLAGSLEYRKKSGQVMTLGIMHGLVPNSGDAWAYTLDTLGRYYERVASYPEDDPRSAAALPGPLVRAIDQEVPQQAAEIIGVYLESARLLGDRTGAMHLALASETEDKEFTPEPFTPFYQRSLYQSMRNQTTQHLQLLRKRLKNLPEHIVPQAQRLSEMEPEILRRFRAITDRKISAMRIRTHGDYHLGQVLYTGKDFVIIDFEGEPARSLSERRIKRSPTRDVAGMLRSFHYAAYAVLYRQVEHGIITLERMARLEYWATYWTLWVSVVFLQSYLRTTGSCNFLPRSQDELEVMLEANLLDKAIYELGYELNNRPSWLPIPVQGILHLLDQRHEK